MRERYTIPERPGCSLPSGAGDSGIAACRLVGIERPCLARRFRRMAHYRRSVSRLFGMVREVGQAGFEDGGVLQDIQNPAMERPAPCDRHLH